MQHTKNIFMSVTFSWIGAFWVHRIFICIVSGVHLGFLVILGVCISRHLTVHDDNGSIELLFNNILWLELWILQKPWNGILLKYLSLFLFSSHCQHPLDSLFIRYSAYIYTRHFLEIFHHQIVHPVRLFILIHPTFCLL